MACFEFVKVHVTAWPGAGVTVTPFAVWAQPVPLATNVQFAGTVSVITYGWSGTTSVNT